METFNHIFIYREQEEKQKLAENAEIVSTYYWYLKKSNSRL